MPSVTRPANQPGEFLVDYEEKVFPDVKAEPGEKALLTFHTVAFEGSIGLVNLLQASRLINKGFETSNIAAHFAENIGQVYIDVFSCKAFDVEAALGICKKYFKPTQANIHNMDRGFHQANQARVKNFTKEGRNACAA